MSTAELEYAIRKIASELAHQTRPESKVSRHRAYWYALYELADQLPSDLVTVFPATSEGLFSIGPLRQQFPFPLDRYPPHLRTIEALNAHLVQLAAVRRADFFTAYTPMYSFSYRTAADGQMDHRGSDLMYLREHGYPDRPPVGYLWTTGAASTTLNPDTLRVERPTMDGYWVREGSDLRTHRDDHVYASPLEAFARIAVGVLRWVSCTFEGKDPIERDSKTGQLRDSLGREQNLVQWAVLEAGRAR